MSDAVGRLETNQAHLEGEVDNSAGFALAVEVVSLRNKITQRFRFF